MENSTQVEQSSYGFRESEVNESKKSIPWYMLPAMYFVRPDKFMRSWGIHANIGWVLIAAWLIGSSGMINTVVNRVRLAPDSLPISINSWGLVWGIVLGFGILRGVITAYGIGTLWTWLRLRICGVKGNEWSRSARIFNLSMLVNEIPSILLLVYLSLKYDTLRDFIAQPVGLGNLIAALFILWTPIFAFLGVRSCYNLRVVWATILFLIIPMLWRVLMILSLLYALLFSVGSPLLPDTQHPISFSDSQFSFEHPSDWIVMQDTELDQHSIAQIELKSNTARSSVLIRVLRREGIDPNEHDLALIEAMGFSVIEKTVHQSVRMGELYGYGEEYKLRKEGQEFVLFHLLAGLDAEHGVLIRSLTSKRYENASKYALQQVVDSLVIASPDVFAPDLNNTKTVKRDWFTHQGPGNWSEVLDQHAQYNAVEQLAFRDTYIRFTLYDRVSGGGGKNDPQKELSALLGNGKHVRPKSSHDPMNSWMGFEGVGARGRVWQPLGGFCSFKAIFVPLADGRVLGIKKYQAESSAQLTNPGFELIESSFKLLLESDSESESVDPDDEP